MQQKIETLKNKGWKHETTTIFQGFTYRTFTKGNRTIETLEMGKRGFVYFVAEEQ